MEEQRSDEVTELLRQMHAAQLEALQLQREQRAAFDAYLARSEKSMTEALELQRAAVARQRQITGFVLPLILLLLALLGYLLVRWRIL